MTTWRKEREDAERILKKLKEWQEDRQALEHLLWRTQASINHYESLLQMNKQESAQLKQEASLLASKCQEVSTELDLTKGTLCIAEAELKQALKQNQTLVVKIKTTKTV